MAEASRSAKINEGPFTLEFSLIEKYSQGRLMIGSDCSTDIFAVEFINSR